jgi:cytochrome c
VLIIFAGAVFIYSGAYYVGADQPHWSTTSWLLDRARIRSIRSHASGIAIPTDLGTEHEIVAGVGHFADHCVICHGAPGVPQGDIAHGLYPRPPSLRAAAGFYMPAELFWIIKHGIKMSGMPAWTDHSDDELWAIVAVLEALPEMSEQDYAKLVAASQVQGRHHHEGHEAQPPPEVAHPPGGPDRDQPAGHQH